MKYLFFLQSEGRGHLTQALTIAKEIRDLGHEVVGVIMNQNPTRKIPAFFIEEIRAPIHYIKSPYFLTNKEGNGIDFSKSVVFNLFRLKSYIQSLKIIHKLYKRYQPDVVLNFFEPLFGFYNLFFKQKVPSFSIGHQFFIEHPAFKKPIGYFKDYQYFSFYNQITSYGSSAIIALSFTKEEDLQERNLFVCPPLLRAEVKKLQPQKKDFILSYILNAGYFEEIKNWAEKNPNQTVEAFWDKKGENDVKQIGKNLRFHPLSGPKFLELLENCSTYISTGGFESICEAAYLQKDVLMVPTKNHYEQLCNAYDAYRAGLAVFDSFFNIDLVVNNKKALPEESRRVFKDWVDSESAKLINIITLKD